MTGVKWHVEQGRARPLAGLLATDYGIIADLYRLDGEFDLNVAVEVKGEVRWVLKIMRPDCGAGLVEMQMQRWPMCATLILTCQFPD